MSCKGGRCPVSCESCGLDQGPVGSTALAEGPWVGVTGQFLGVSGRGSVFLAGRGGAGEGARWSSSALAGGSGPNPPGAHGAEVGRTLPA